VLEVLKQATHPVMLPSGRPEASAIGTILGKKPLINLE